MTEKMKRKIVIPRDENYNFLKQGTLSDGNENVDTEDELELSFTTSSSEEGDVEETSSDEDIEETSSNEDIDSNEEEENKTLIKNYITKDLKENRNNKIKGIQDKNIKKVTGGKTKKLEKNDKKTMLETNSKIKKNNKSKNGKKLSKVNKTEQASSVDGNATDLKGNDEMNRSEDVSEKRDEYAYDSSDEEDAPNTIGNVPLEWYKDFEHIGYDLTGKKILKDGQEGDELDEFIQKMDNPDYWRTVRNRTTGKKVVLSDEDVALIKKYMRCKYTEASIYSIDPFTEPFVRETMIHPVTNRPEDKRSFIPSNWERLKVGQLVHAMKMGWIKISATEDNLINSNDVDDDREPEPKFYELWTSDSSMETKHKIRQYIAAPKMKPPGHEESYNAPPEYLFTPEEEQKWLNTPADERRIGFIPKRFASLRQVPGYDKFVEERFERCLDLYLCPRQMKMRANVRAKDLLPKLPSPRDLQPYPTVQSLIFRGHTGAVLCITIDPTGHWIASGSEDKTIKFWEISTGRCLRTVGVTSLVHDLTWNPRPTYSLLAAAVGDQLLILNALLGSQVESTDHFLATFKSQEVATGNGETIEKKKVPVEWETVLIGSEDANNGIRLILQHPKQINHICWQSRGDYVAVVMGEALSLSLLLHRLSSRLTVNPFNKPKGLIQRVAFHPSKPMLFVATQQYIRVYDLIKQQLTKKLHANCKWISSLDIHPQGDNLIIGSYDARVSWFDLQLSDKPYQTLKNHKRAVRQISYHNNLPLFASASDDGTIIVCHGRVFSDFTVNPLIVPVKVLKGHVTTKGLGVLDCVFHPTEPWILSAGADHTIRLFS